MTQSGHPASLQDCNRSFFASMKGEAPLAFPPVTSVRDAMKQAGLIRHRVNEEANRVLNDARERAKAIVADAQAHARTIVIKAREAIAAGNTNVPEYQGYDPDDTLLDPPTEGELAEAPDDDEDDADDADDDDDDDDDDA